MDDQFDDTGAVLRAWRGDRTHAEAAKILECDKSLIGRLEEGKRRPGLDLANSIKRHVGIPTEAWIRKRSASAAEPVSETA